MNRWMLTIAVTGVGLLVLAAERSDAQRGRARGARQGGAAFENAPRYGGWDGRRYGWDQPYGWHAGGFYAAPGSYQSFYPPDLADEPALGSTARVTVYVPDPNAELWFNGTRMEEQGTTRSFTTPPLSADQDYHYSVRARWMDNGRPIDMTRTVPVMAGQQARVDFRAAGRGAGDVQKRAPADRRNLNRDGRPPVDGAKRTDREPADRRDINGRPPADNRKLDDIRRPADTDRPAGTNPRPKADNRRPLDSNRPFEKDTGPSNRGLRPDAPHPVGDFPRADPHRLVSC
jgi:uncharacterized protein (TIGR03000 family)